MKKLLVFLSIFAVLFVSTIRPLQAEYLVDNFRFVNGRTYYFVIDEQLILNDYTICYNDDVYPWINLTLLVPNDYLDIKLSIMYKTTSSSQTQYFTIVPTYLGTIYDYVTPNGTINGYVYSFVWTLPTVINIVYDDYMLAFDTENPLPPVSIYDTIYSIINKFVFGYSIESGSHQDLIATLLSSIAVVFVFALPFLLVWKVVKLIMG